ncbi:flavodoxin family protein [Chloroflexota bacterium]
MKILGLSCSPRKSGNTAILVAEALDGARSEGGEVELYSLAGKEIKPCDGCNSCHKTGKCHINDDMQAIYPKLLEADGIIFGTPVYFHAMTAQAKALIDRTFVLRHPSIGLASKVGGVIAVAGRLGIIDTLKSLYFYFAYNHMIPADSVIAYAREKGTAKDDEMTMKSAWELGREMAQIVDQKFKFPGEFDRGLMAYVMNKYGLL